MLYRFLLADTEDRSLYRPSISVSVADIKNRSFAEACIGRPYRFGVTDTREEDPKTRIDLSYRLSLADTKKTEPKEDCRSSYRPACIDLL
ncbi:unnamed protein product [Cochlearia groenlandica]